MVSQAVAARETAGKAKEIDAMERNNAAKPFAETQLLDIRYINKSCERAWDAHREKPITALWSRIFLQAAILQVNCRSLRSVDLRGFFHNFFGLRLSNGSSTLNLKKTEIKYDDEIAPRRNSSY
jgi:hypothetical protein